MTVEELLSHIGIEKIHLDNFAKNNEYLKYKLTFEYEEEQGNRSHYVTEYVFDIDINSEKKTITLKG